MPPKKEVKKKVGSGWWGKFMIAVFEVVTIVREKDREHDLPDGFFKNRDFLEEVGFFKDLEASYSGVKVIEDKRNKKIRLKGRGNKFWDACNKCDNVLIKLLEEKHDLKDVKMWKIIQNNEDYVKKIIASRNIRAKVVLDGSGKSVRITAMDDVEWRKAVNALEESIIIEQVQVPSDVDIISESDEFQKFQKEQEKKKVLKIELRTSNDRKSKVMALIGTKEAVAKAKSLTQQFIASNPSTKGMCGTVTIVLKKGDITMDEGDVIINVLPNNVKLIDGGTVCRTILIRGGNTVQQEIDDRKNNSEKIIGAILHTSAGSIQNVKNIIHFVPSRLDVLALQDGIESCLRLAQKCSFRCILIPAIGTGNLGLSSEYSAHIILNAAANISITSNHCLTLTIVVYQEKMLPHFKMVLEEKMKYSPSLVTQEMNLVEVPSTWAAQPQGKVVHLVNLLRSSVEYKTIFKLFNNGNSACEVTKIERIQNPGLYRAYIVKKQSMAGEVNERRLFHGTNIANIDKINTTNFSRSFAGENGKLYGNGVYFAQNSSYSIGYCQSRAGWDFKMYIAKVLVGVYTLGEEGMKAPPSRNDQYNPGLQFDSLVNNINDPSMFVIFQDNQHYPEYLVSFKQ